MDGLRNGEVEGDARCFPASLREGMKAVWCFIVCYLCDHYEQTEVPGVMMTSLYLTKYLIKLDRERQGYSDGGRQIGDCRGWGLGTVGDLRESVADGIVPHSVCGGDTRLCRC